MSKALVTGPALDPVSLAEAKAHCRVAISDDDGLIAGYLLAARQIIETELRRSLISQTWDYFVDCDWPCEKVGGQWHRRITLPLPPLLSVTSISYVDSSGGTQTLAADQYRVSTKRHEGVIEPAYGVTWPPVRDQVDAITVRFVCGYGPNPSDVPEPIRQAILLLVGHWYENREAVNVGNIVTPLPFAVDALLFPFRVFY
jgi:uncharacterized phiE125 gp8 family phage protein